MNWNELYSLGSKKIDTEHKMLFKIAAEAFSVVSPDKKLLKIKTVLKKLIEYTKIHFNDEEQYMQSIGYPELNTQKDHHKKIIISMNNFTKQLSKKSLYDVEKELARLIEIWFIHHIVYEDKKISQWLLTHDIPEYTFSWKNSYSIKNTTIDAEHQELFKIASEAFKNVPENERINKIKNTLNKLSDYFYKHFKDEEEYMKSIKYDKLDSHKKIHQDIIKTLNNFLKRVPQMDIEDIEEELKNFIEKSLVSHILEEDKKITLWVKYLEDLKEAKELREM